MRMFSLGRVEMRRGLLLCVLAFLILVLTFVLKKRVPQIMIGNVARIPLQGDQGEQLELDWLSACRHVYLDVGTNVGVQIRKVFEPALYPKALLHKYFQRHFGPEDRRGSQVCAIGFEPNPRFEKRLKELENSYNACGFRTKIFTKTGASFRNSPQGAMFWSDGREESNEAGGTIVHEDQLESLQRGNVDLLRLSDFILQRVDAKSKGGSVLMKIDIEGSELEVMTDLLLSGALSRVSLSFVEWHLQNKNTRGRDLDRVKSLIENTNMISQKYNLTDSLYVIKMDDETYSMDNHPLPQC